MNSKYFKHIKNQRGTVLCTADKALGLGDGVMMLSTIRDLSKIYDIRLMATESVSNIIKYIKDDKHIKVYTTNDQGYFYTNDHIRAYNLIYWETYNSLRHFPHHAINMIRQNANLPLYTFEDQQSLPDIPIDPNIVSKMKDFTDSLKPPIILMQPFMSYFNKMIEPSKYHAIFNKLKDLGTIIQIGGNVPSHMIGRGGVNLIGRTSIDQSIALLKCADVLISCDSFLQHASAHTKTPTVVLWCGTSSAEFGYPFHANICYPEFTFCQGKCARPMRWLFDYHYTDKKNWSTRHESGWICPNKICERVIDVQDVVNATLQQISIGRDRNWSFYDPIFLSWKQDPLWKC